MLNLDLSGDEILLTEEARVVEPTENDHSDIHNPQKELEETAKQDNTDTQNESSPNFYRERGEEAEPGMNDSATSITSSVASIGKISATEVCSVPEVNDQVDTEDGIETSTVES